MTLELTAKLNAATPLERLDALKQLVGFYAQGKLTLPPKTDYVNNHIHSIYSFSPYSPTSAAYTAWLNGLGTAGIMDHDSVAGGEEFVEAARMLGIGATVGFECRCSMDRTPFAGKRINNPDQLSVAYLVCHGVPHQNIGKVQDWLAPVRHNRNLRNRKMVDNLNTLLEGSGVALDFDMDVLPLSQAENGGSVTERHLLYALAFAITEKLGKGAPAAGFVQERLGLDLPGKVTAKLMDAGNPAYEYDLLGVLKAGLVEKFYVPATDECPNVEDFLTFTKGIGAIPAYAYLGDVGDSVTGDKKAQKFEDDYLDELVPWLAKAGFEALTFMPTRNTAEQLERLMALCRQYSLFQISGEDINSPSQSFICEALKDKRFSHLVTSTWALIGHERAATLNQQDGMFASKTVERMPELAERVEHFSQIGKKR